MTVASQTRAPRVLRNVKVPMRDGVLLATDVFLPDGPGPWPALLERTPYDRTAPRANEYTRAHPEVFGREELAGFFTDAGFAVVFQDCRGRYGSGGRFTKYRGEAEDGFDTLDWIAAQDWHDGQTGTMGMSYSAHTQMAAAALDPPGLAAMILDCGGFANAYQGGIRFGGALELKQVTWAFRHALRSRAAAADPVARKALESVDIADWFHRMPWKRGQSPLSAIPDYEDYLFGQWERTVFDDYWKVPALYAVGHHAAMPKVPSVHMSGWYDPYAVTAIDNFRGLRAQGHPVQLIVGPWTHGNRSRTYAGDVDFGPAAAFDGAVGPDFVRWRIDYFRRHMQGADLPDGPPVQVFVMGGGSGRRTAEGRLDHGGHWITARDWPPETAVPLDLHLHPGGGLSRKPAQIPAKVSYISDPERPVPTIGGPITSGAPVMQGGAFDQHEGPQFFGSAVPYLPTASRPDVLVFQTAPLTETLTLVGDVALHLFVSSDGPTTDFTAKLVDVHPPNEDYPHGFAMNLCDGILRACYRNGFDRVEPLTPGAVHPLTVTLYPTANRFLPGHRIRIEIASSNFPRFDVNPQADAGDDLAQTRFRSVNTVHMGGDVPSRLMAWALV
jgi:uncharacterized protein